MDCGQKSFMLMWLYQLQLLSGFLFCVHFSLASHQPVNDKDDNKTVLGAVHRFPGICLTSEEDSRKPQLGDR